MNILFLGSPEAVHDIKWMSFFSGQKEFRVFLISEYPVGKQISPEVQGILEEKQITYCGGIAPYSLKKPFRTWRSVVFIRNICKKNKIDIVHALAATPYAMWAYFSKTPYIITSRGTDVLKTIPALHDSGFRKPHLRFLYRIFKKSFKNAAYVTSTSYQQVASIKEMFSITNIEVVRTGVEVDFISNTIDDSVLPIQLKGSDYINSPRGIRALYNSKTQVEAISMLDDAILKKYTFVFYTRFTEPYDYLLEFEEMLKQQTRIKYIILKGLPSQVVLSCIKYGALNIMIPESDGTPNTALESMAAKCPLILGSFDYDKDLFTGTCIRLKENSAEALAAAITEALNHYPKEYLDNAFARVSEFGNRPVEMNKIKNIYSKVLNNPHEH